MVNVHLVVEPSKLKMTDKPDPIRKRTDMSSIPTKQYIDQTVAPILLEGLKSLAKERPADPIQYLADYLLKHKANNGDQIREEPAESEQS